MKLLVTCVCTLAIGLAPAVLGNPAHTPQAIQAREAYILGQPQRIEPLSADELDADTLAVVDEMRASIGAAPVDELPEYFATLLRHPQLLHRQAQMATVFHQGYLSPRDRQLAILRVAWLCQAPYEWGEHVQVSKRVAGISSEDIERVTLGSAAPGWSDHERAILRAVEELHGDAMISDATWNTLAETLDERQLLELPALVGTYQTVAYMQNAVRFRLMEGNEGLMMR